MEDGNLYESKEEMDKCLMLVHGEQTMFSECLSLEKK